MGTLSTGWLWLFAVGTLALLWVLGARARLGRLRARILSAWKPLVESLDRELGAQAALHAGVAAPLAGERAALDAQTRARERVLEALGAVRRRPAQAEGMTELSQAVAALQVAGQRLQALVAHDTALLADAGVADAMASLQALPAQRQFLRQAFNDAVAQYNSAQRQWPTRLVVRLLRLGPAGPV